MNPNISPPISLTGYQHNHNPSQLFTLEAHFGDLLNCLLSHDLSSCHRLHSLSRPWLNAVPTLSCHAPHTLSDDKWLLGSSEILSFIFHISSFRSHLLSVIFYISPSIFPLLSFISHLSSLLPPFSIPHVLSCIFSPFYLLMPSVREIPPPTFIHYSLSFYFDQVYLRPVFYTNV